MRVIFRFRDCFSTGDTCQCHQDITESGGESLGHSSTHGDTNIGEVPFDVDDHGKFMEKFRTTKSYAKLIKE